MQLLAAPPLKLIIPLLTQRSGFPGLEAKVKRSITPHPVIGSQSTRAMDEWHTLPPVQPLEKGEGRARQGTPQRTIGISDGSVIGSTSCADLQVFFPG